MPLTDSVGTAHPLQTARLLSAEARQQGISIKEAPTRAKNHPPARPHRGAERNRR